MALTVSASAAKVRATLASSVSAVATVKPGNSRGHGSGCFAGVGGQGAEHRRQFAGHQKFSPCTPCWKAIACPPQGCRVPAEDRRFRPDGGRIQHHAGWCRTQRTGLGPVQTRQRLLHLGEQGPRGRGHYRAEEVLLDVGGQRADDSLGPRHDGGCRGLG